jgi:hypothetical protein
MFERQMKLIWQYRFFYLELNTLLQNDARLKVLFLDNRKRRVQEVKQFFMAMIDEGYFNLGDNQKTLDSILLSSWLISDQWPQYLDMNEMELNKENISKGFKLLDDIFRPYYSEKAIKEDQRIIQQNNINKPDYRIHPIA